MSSSAFFIEAAANTVMVLSCAAAGGAAAHERARRSKTERRVNGVETWRRSMRILRAARAHARLVVIVRMRPVRKRRSGAMARARRAGVCGIPSDARTRRSNRQTLALLMHGCHCARSRQSELGGTGEATWLRRRRSKATTTTSSSARARPAACSPTACPPIRTTACCCSKPAARTTGSGFTSRSAICSRSAIRAPTGCSRPSPSRG